MKKLACLTLCFLSLAGGYALASGGSHSRDAVIRCNTNITEDMTKHPHLVDYRADGEIVYRCDKRGF